MWTEASEPPGSYPAAGAAPGGGLGPGGRATGEDLVAPGPRPQYPAGASWQAVAQDPARWAARGAYVHVPFCVRRCLYCGFATFVPAGRQAWAEDAYLAALQRELAFYGRCLNLAAWPPLQSLYLGGGTPSFLTPEALGRLLGLLRRFLPLDPEAEITCEANPESLDAEKLAVLRDNGVNRLSLGLQAAQDRLLRLLGRPHGWAQGVAAVKAARATGFRNISVDLMYGLPEQTMAEWRETLRRALALEPDHISAYELQIEEEQSALARRGAWGLPGEEETAEMYGLAQDELAGAGFGQYEISNWALPGRACRHNLLYWRDEPYAAFGPGASGYLGGVRFRHTSSFRAWLQAWEQWIPQPAGQEVHPALEEWEEIPAPLERAEAMIVGLRLRAGVSSEAFRTRFGTDPQQLWGPALAELQKEGWMENHGSRWSLPRRALLVSNQILWRFLPTQSRVRGDHG